MINVKELDNRYDFEITGPSYIGRPVSNTFMFITKKVESSLMNLSTINNCLVFAEEGINVDRNLLKNNCFIFSKTPQLDYSKFAIEFDNMKRDINSKRKYTYQNGYYIGENVKIGDGSLIEIGCFIDHDVVIGSNCKILSGAIIRNSIIGDNVLVNERAVIGANGFNMTDDENGNKMRIPTLGQVIISNNCEIGALNNISCGIGGATFFDEYVKLDAHVHIGHDVQIGKNVEITSGCIVAGFVEIGEKSYLGVGSVIKNRIKLGEKCFIGMGAVVMKNVAPGEEVAGNPARGFGRK